MLKKLALLLSSIALLGAVVLYGWYQIDGIPTAEADSYLAGDKFSIIEPDDGSLFFQPEESNGYGIVIMHGALIKPKSYAKTAAYFARLGYTVFVPYGFGRLSINAINSIPERLKRFPVKDWYFIGHSMGGMASMEVITRHNLPVKALALWATAMPNDYSDVELPVLLIVGNKDGLLPADRLARSREYLPESTRYVPLKGANHKNFALYSHQFFDNDATLNWMQQIDFANETTAEFFSLHR